MDTPSGRVDLSGSTHSSRKCRIALTLVEMLVVMAIIGIFFSVLSMAVLASRAIARRTQCVSNLKQIGIAIGHYESTYRVFPCGLSYYGSLHVSILPFLEQESLYLSIEKQKNESRRPLRDVPSLPLFLCPEDYTPSERAAGTNYAGCSGTWWLSAGGMDGMFRYWPQLYNEQTGPVAVREVTDGLSATISLSEILRSDAHQERLRVNWNTPTAFHDIDTFAQACRSLPRQPTALGWQGASVRGIPWTNGNLGATLYNHVLTPSHPSCYNGSDVLSMAATAVSGHRGGVNVLFGDGHQTFVSNSIDSITWRNLAARANGK